MPSSRARSPRTRLLSALLVSATCASAAVLPARLSVWLRSAAAANTFVVTTNADSGAGSLRQAITDANANAGLDTISFQIGTGVQTITLLSDLPIISDPVVIDGTTQPGYAGAPIIELNGNLSGRSNTFHAGLDITAGNSVVRGLVVNRFSTGAILLATNGGNVVENCYIGTDLTGTLRRPNGLGLSIGSTHNTIGGATASARNVISGNGSEGISLFTTAATDNVIQGNYIGTDASGAVALANGGNGIQSAVRNCLIGGSAPGAGNVISGNGGSGMEINSGNTVQGNFIGTDATGMKAIPNLERGIRMIGTATGNHIGGAQPGERNVISGNSGAAISLEDGANGNVVRGNYIGVTADASAPLPNSTVTAGNSSGGIFIKNASDNVVGGTGAGEGNLIAFNGAGGVIVVPASDTAIQKGNTIRGNSIFSNDGLGIDLLPFGVTPNDAGDTDAGANNRQNFPILTSTGPSDGISTTTSWSLNSKPNTTYAIDFYTNRACDPSGNGEGALYVGSSAATTDAAGDAAFEFALSSAEAARGAIVATATDPEGSTSEFSACNASDAFGSAEFSVVQLSAIEDVGALPIKVVRTGGTAATLTVNYTTLDGTATAGNDYLPAQGSLTFAPGETEKTITLNVLNDSVTEGNETLSVQLTSPDGLESLGVKSTLRLTLLDNGTLPVLSINSASVKEGDAGTTSAAVPITLSAATGRIVTVNYATAGGLTFPATPGVDYQNVSGTLTFNPAETQKIVNVPVVGDTLDEPDETFRVVLSNATNASNFVNINPPVTTILDDDPPPSLSINDTVVTEGTGGTTLANFNLTLSAPSGRTVTAQLSVAPGTATAGSDYFPPQPPIIFTFDPGQTTKSFSVQVTTDSVAEPDETFFVNIVFVQNAVLAKAQGVGTIIDDDSSPRVQFAASQQVVGEADARANVTVTRSGDISTTSSVDVRTVDNPAPVRCDDVTTLPGVAFARCDYATTVQTLVFAPNETTKTVTIPLVNDSFVEPNESLTLSLTNPTGATLGAQATMTLTITSDDAAGAPNPIFSTDFFVRMQYLDFLSREPEAGQPWSATLNNCAPNDPACDRISVSANFFRSQEFQLKGLFVFRFYKVSFGRLPLYSEIVADMASVTGVTTAEVNTKKAAYTSAFAQRQEFKNAYDAMNNAQFVNTLMNRYGITSITTPNPSTPDDTAAAAKVTLTLSDLINQLDQQSLTRARVVRAIADSNEVSAAEFNPAFVAMQYFGYLRRDPDAAGYQAWLNTINANPADFRSMVNGFMNSTEYRLRFGQP